MKIHNIVDGICIGLLATASYGLSWTCAAIFIGWALISALAESYDDGN